MSMYAELIAASLAERRVEGEPTDWGDLLSRVIGCRQRLAARTQRVDAEGDLATNIEYDLALLQLCAARDIPVDPRHFDRPGQERRRLESELAKRGIDLDGRPR